VVRALHSQSFASYSNDILSDYIALTVFPLYRKNSVLRGDRARFQLFGDTVNTGKVEDRDIRIHLFDIAI
jgi:hypothetical protein